MSALCFIAQGDGHYTAAHGRRTYAVRKVRSLYTANQWEVRLDEELLSDWPSRNLAISYAVQHARAHPA